MSTIIDKAKEFADLSMRKMALQAQIKTLDGKLNELSKEIKVLNDDAGLEKIPLQGLGTVKFVSRTNGKVVDDKAFFAWLKANEMEDLAKYSVHHMTLSSLCREAMENGEEPPAGVDVSFFEKVSFSPQ